MSDYMQRLVQRAIPVSLSGQRQVQEIKPFRTLYGDSVENQQADFQVETDLSESPPDLAPPGTPRAETVGTEMVSPGDLPAQQAASWSPAAHERARLQPAPVLRQESPGIAPSRAAERRPDKILSPRPMSAPAAVEGDKTTVPEPPPVVPAQTGALQQVRPEIFRPLEVTPAPAQVQSWQPDPVHGLRGQGHLPAPEPEAASATIVRSPNAEERGVARLEPQSSTQPEFNPAPSEPAQLTIGSLTVEVLPAPPSPPAHQAAPTPVVQVTRVVQAPSREGRPSKLKFGLGQM